MTRIYKSIGFILFLFLTFGCGGSKDKKPFVLEDEANVTPIEIKRLDKTIEGYAQLDSMQRLETLKENYKELLGFGMFADQTDTVFTDMVAFWSIWPATTAFMPEVNSLYEDLSAEETAISKVIAGARQNNLDVKDYEYVSVTWGRPNPIVIIDTLNTVYVALNHYLGPENSAYNGWPTYVCAFKKRDMIPVDIAEALVSISMPYDATGSGTVLSRMLYEGSRAVAKEALVPEASLSDILSLTPAAITETRQNEPFLWNSLLRENKLYSTDRDLISNLFDIRPNSTAISPDAPGRAVRLVGYNIVKEYLEKHPEITLKYLLSPEFYDNGTEVLRESGYNPE